jgi:hypothetical protein
MKPAAAAASVQGIVILNGSVRDMIIQQKENFKIISFI